MTDSPEIITAAMIAIGDELLSGRTRDRNISQLARLLNLKGLELKEVRIVADDEPAIVKAVNTLRVQHDYVFTSGGIGPTHDDITSDAIARAFKVGIDYHPRAFAMLEEHYAARKMPFTTARKKMARIPAGASLIENKVSVAPGFQIGNVFVLAGVPAVFNAMLLAIEPELKSGTPMQDTSLDCNLGEGTIGDELSQIATAHSRVSIGSYPRFDGNSFTTRIVVRSHSRKAIDNACADIRLMLSNHENS